METLLALAVLSAEFQSRVQHAGVECHYEPDLWNELNQYLEAHGVP
jgi:hypothetical protein